MGRSRLHWWILLGIVAGALWGTWLNRAYYAELEARAKTAILGPSWSAEAEAAAAKRIQAAVDEGIRRTFWGGAAYGLAGLFLALLKMVVIPLVVSSLISGVVGMGDFKRLGKVGGKTAAWYVGTGFLAITTGLLLVNLIGPGRSVTVPLPESGEAPALPTSAWDFVLAMVPENVFKSAASFELLPLIVFAMLFGVFLLATPAPQRAPVEAFVNGVFEVMMRLTVFVISFSPVGIAALVAKLVASTGPKVFASLAGYVVTVGAGLAIHAFVTLPLLVWLVTRRNPYRVMRIVSPALLTAFSTASSSGTLPLTMERVENGVGVSNKISSFVLPLGATVNMNGTALYECVATIFVAQLYAQSQPGFALSAGAQFTVVVLALLVSIGAAGIPHAGLVMMVIIFQAVGLPVGLTALLWAVDRPLDMVRSAVNIWSDMCGAVAIAHTEGEIDESVLAREAGA